MTMASNLPQPLSTLLQCHIRVNGSLALINQLSPIIGAGPTYDPIKR